MLVVWSVNFLRWVLFTVWFAAPLAARAHGDVHDQITLVTQQIREETTNATLYLKRGELNRFHHDWDAAQSDYDKVTQLMPEFAAIDFFRGRMLLEAGRPRPARACLDGFLKKHYQQMPRTMLRYAIERHPERIRKQYLAGTI